MNVLDTTRVFAVALALAALLAPGVAAQQVPEPEAPPKVSVTEAQLLATFGAPDTDDPYWVLTLQHFSLWRHGSNFFFLDVRGTEGLNFFDATPGLYLEYAPVVSLGSFGITRREGYGALRDIGATLQLNTGWTPEPFPINRVYLEGVELQWTVPRFSTFNTQFLARQERTYDASWQFTWIYTLPLAVGPARGELIGFLDLWQRKSDDVPRHLVLLAQPQLRFDLGRHAPGESFLQLGVEVEPSVNFPTRSIHRGWNLALSPMLRWVF